jgi:putative ATPase
VYPVPMHLRDAHYSGASSYGHGEGYLYTHDHPEATQTFLPEALQGKRYI